MHAQGHECLGEEVSKRVIELVRELDCELGHERMNDLNDKCVQVKMVYLIHVIQHEPRRLDLTNVWTLHAASRSICKAAVDMRTETQDPAEMVLRIRCDSVTFNMVLSLWTAQSLAVCCPLQ